MPLARFRSEPPDRPEEIVVPGWFLASLLLFVIVGFWIMNAFYYRNQKDELSYKRERWRKQQEAAQHRE